MTLLFFLVISLGIQILLFIPAFLLKTDKLTDLSYSLSFAALAVTGTLLSSREPLELLACGLILAWSARLGIFLFTRILKMKRDKRFDGVRENFFRFASFWLIQGVTVWLVLLPYVLMLNRKSVFTVVTGSGLLIWAAGLIIETTADFQKKRFRDQPENKGRWIETGLWKVSRHPNYFGEVLCWIGFYLFTYSSLTTTSRLIALVSPLAILALLLFFSGIPPLEKSADRRWGEDKDYKAYKERTSLLIPWRPKNDS
jgi:steroid 5-alpha reductase family enzyme